MKRDLIGAAQRVTQSLRKRSRARGDAARDAGNWPAAIAAYEAHLATHPEDVAIWVQLGHANKEAGEFEEALLAYSKAQALNPRDADLFLSFGHLYKVWGRVDLALEAYDESVSFQPDLLAGAAMIAREHILGRVTWRDEGGAIPANLPDLLAAIEQAESEGRRLFQGYYQSFETR